MYWSAVLSLFAGMVSDTPLESPIGTYRLRYHRAEQRAELVDPTNQSVMSWTGLAKHDAEAKARDWLADAAFAQGHNPLYDDRYYAQRQGLA